MLEGKSAPTVCGSAAARQPRAVLMVRCQQTVSIIQRFQAEARAVQTAAERHHIDAAEYTAFEQTDVNVKAEIDTVKLEAEWLSGDSGTHHQDMGSSRRRLERSDLVAVNDSILNSHLRIFVPEWLCRMVSALECTIDQCSGKSLTGHVLECVGTYRP